jgi:type II secretory pathway predicted ATPase ExeA
MMMPLLRPVEMDQHPLMQQTYILPTVSIDEAYTEVKRCIRHRIPGALLVGQSRFGKTYCARYISRLLKEDFPKLVVLTVGSEKKKAPVESAFFENLLQAAEHKELKHGSNSEKRRRLIARLVELVTRSRQNLLVLFYDEAQRLFVEEYEWLRDVHDQLERRGIRMITFLIGQQKLLNQKNALRMQGETQIIGRFMIDELPFHGVRTADEAATCLNAYDEACYPLDSDWSYTRFYLPLAYEAGLRLVDQTVNAWAAFLAAHAAAGFRFPIDIPMQYFSRTVEIVLTDHSDHDAAGFALTPAIWEQAVHDARYVAAVEELRLNPELDD